MMRWLWMMVYLTAAGAAVPPMMRAVHIAGTCQKPAFPCISTNTVRTPAPKDTEVLIRVTASSVNPCDVDAVELGPTSGFACGITPTGTPGSDVAGQVVAVGALCKRIVIGDWVWTDVLDRGGAMAQYVVASEQRVGVKPLNLDPVDAGTIPLDGVTALQCLQQLGAPWSGKTNLTVVVTSGTGGTGFMGLQLAKALGATRLITAASGAGISFAKSLGADVVIDYKKQNIFDAIPDNTVDFVFDNHGAKGTADLAMPKMRVGGTYGLLFGNSNATLSDHPKPGVGQLRFKNVNASSYKSLDLLKTLFETGRLHAHVQQAFTLDQAATAFATSAGGGVQGKIAVTTNTSQGGLRAA